MGPLSLSPTEGRQQVIALINLSHGPAALCEGEALGLLGAGCRGTWVRKLPGGSLSPRRLSMPWCLCPGPLVLPARRLCRSWSVRRFLGSPAAHRTKGFVSRPWIHSLDAHAMGARPAGRSRVCSLGLRMVHSTGRGPPGLQASSCGGAYYRL